MPLSILGCSQDSPTTKNQPASNVSNAETQKAWCRPGTRRSKDTAMRLEESLESVHSGGWGGVRKPNILRQQEASFLSDASRSSVQ